MEAFPREGAEATPREGADATPREAEVNLAITAGLSFALQAQKAKRTAVRPAAGTAGDRPAAAFVTSFSADDPTLAEAASAQPKAINLQPNTNLLNVERRGSRGEPASGATLSAGECAPAGAPVVEDENAAAVAALLADVQSGMPVFIFGGAMAAAESGANSGIVRPADSLDIAYDEVPVEEFGKAMLRGMGWAVGMGIGRRMEDPNQPVEYVARQHRLGLGAQPKVEEPKVKKHLRPGESREPKPDLVYVDAEGRQRHIKPVGEKLTVRGPTGLQKGALVSITHGPHAGLDGTIQTVGGIEGNKKATVTLRLNEQTVLIPLEHLSALSPAAVAAAAHAEAAAAAAAKAAKAAVAKAASVKGGGKEGARAEERGERGGSSNREKKGGQKRSREQQGDAGREGGERREGEREHARARAEKVWVIASIRVRVVDQRVHRGALYNRKGVVVDTGGAGEFALLMDDDPAQAGDSRARLREGVTQAMVETALPKPGGSVLVVKGKHRGRRGRLLERDSRKDRAVVQLNGDFSVCTLRFDDLSEWAGTADEAEDEF